MAEIATNAGLQLKTQIGHQDLVEDVKKFVGEIPEGSKEARVMGFMRGRAHGLSYRNNPQDETKPSIALRGVFEGVPADPRRATLRGVRCYLPGSVHDMIVAAIRGDHDDAVTEMPKRGKAIDIDGNVVMFGVEVSVKRTDTPIGYEYAVRTMRELVGNDPLADVREEFKIPDTMQARALAGSGPSITERAQVAKGDVAKLPAPKVKGKKRAK